MTTDASATGYLSDLADVLWPAPAVVSLDVGVDDTGGAATDGASWTVVTRRGQPKLLVPRGSRPAAAAVARHYSEPKNRAAAARNRTLAALFSTGLGDTVFRGRVHLHRPEHTETVAEMLSSALGEPCCVGLHIGPPRANRKPVLTVVSPEGAVLGFAKVGVNDLTNALVAAEAAALQELGRSSYTSMVVPSLLHAGRWNGADVLVQSPLPVWGRRDDAPVATSIRSRAMLEVAAIGRHETDLWQTTFWHAALDRLRAVPPALASAAAAVLDAVSVVATNAPTVVGVGAWHGDWHPSNMAAVGGRLLVWDWERFAGGAPVGVDALHYSLQEAITVRGLAPVDAAAELVRRAPQVLGEVGVPATASGEVTVAYLVHLAARYLGDDQAAAGGRLGDVGHWLVPALGDVARSLSVDRGPQ